MHDAAFGHEHKDLYEQAIDIEGIEQLTLTSVGIDIGSSTTHLLFSRLTLRREGAGHSCQFKVTDREVLWSSPILLTPYLSQSMIDFERIKQFFADCYHSASLAPVDIDTGAVVITGEALKKENAQPISAYFSGAAGKFICASAGPHHEALLAAYGSGSAQLSKAAASRVLNVDIGGGTTKLSLIIAGTIVGTAAINIGARLIAFDQDNRITRMEDAGRTFAERAGYQCGVGEVLAVEAQHAIGRLMARTLIDVLKNGFDLSAFARSMMITPDIALFRGMADSDMIVFSGGVAEFIYGTDDTDFGDLGPRIGGEMRRYLATLPAKSSARPLQGIRATVIGASEYTIQVSGATSWASTVANLPAFGLKAVYVPHVVGTSFAENLAVACRKYDIDGFGPGMAVSLSISGELNYESLKQVAAGLAEFGKTAPDVPMLITIEQDVARTIGRLLKQEFEIPNDLISIDGISVGDLDYIDIGKPVSMMDLFPVTVKSLLFSSDILA